MVFKNDNLWPIIAPRGLFVPGLLLNDPKVLQLLHLSDIQVCTCA